MGGVSGGRRPGSPEAGLRPGRLQEAVERMDNADMSRSKFKGRDLTGAIFAAASVRQADLRDVKADGSTNTFAQFDLSDLRGSSWRRALIDRVTFYGADLRNASFKEAILSGSEFDGADIEGADFTDALLDDKTMRLSAKSLRGATRNRGSTPATACSVIWAGWSASRSWTRLPSTASKSSTPPSAPPAVTEEAAVDKKSPPFF